MKAAVFTPDTCSVKSSAFIDQIFNPLIEVRIASKIICSGTWIERLAIELDAERLFIYLADLELTNDIEEKEFIYQFNRALLQKKKLFITPLSPLPAELRQNCLELKAS